MGVLISIHVPRERDDIKHPKSMIEMEISIHVPRERDDGGLSILAAKNPISIHVPRERDDPGYFGGRSYLSNFNPRPS